MSSVPQETCSLCPPSGPPKHPRSKVATGEVLSSFQAEVPSVSGDNIAPRSEENLSAHSDDDEDDTVLSWIYCPKCTEWYHGVCILSHSEDSKQTVPRAVRNYVEGSEEGIWSDWTEWVDKWYCHRCVATSKDPSNPRPPRYPLLATIDSKSFPPKPKSTVKQTALKRDSTLSAMDNDANVKKQKTGHLPSDKLPRTSEPNDDRILEEDGDRSRSGTADGNVKDEDGITRARPKRQAAMHRPDYHALHHHIATPTARWLDLIHDPEKYNTKISEGNFPRVPASLLRREWLDSARISDNSFSTSVKQEGAPLTPTSDGNRPSTASPYPPNLPPNLYYGPNREPLIIKPEDGGFEGLGGRIPGKGFSVGDVAKLVGPQRMVDVIDVATQQSSQWPLQKWADYVASRFGSNTNIIPGSDPSSSKVYNVISLEISGTKLADMVKPPTIVSEIDWVDNCWNFGPGGKELAVREDMAHVRGEKAEVEKTKGKGKAREPWPKVQLYCLMGAKGSWTDWHVDFAASSVYYTIHTGAKTFFFIRPTQKNLAAYAEWSGSYEKQQTIWLGDMCDEVRKVELKQGDTMMIPAGYIHSVYTPEDSIVFGGNFLHSYDIPTQLRLRQIEIDTKVPQRFRFPFFDKLCWYVAEQHCSKLRSLRSYRPRQAAVDEKAPSERVLHGLLALANFLIAQCDAMEDETTEEKRRKLIHDRIPDKFKDGPALARELKWRIQRELPEHGHEDDEGGEDNVKRETNKERTMKKRATAIIPVKSKSRIWNFSPSPWEDVSSPVQYITRTINLPRPVDSITDHKSEMSSEEAKEFVTIRRQDRKRKKVLRDGTIVVEEQEYVATERRVIWDPIPRSTLGEDNGLSANGGEGDGSLCVD